MERSEINNDLTRNEPIREVRQTKDARTGQATQKKFVADLERRLSPRKKKEDKKKKDEIILQEDEKSDKDKKSDDRGRGKDRQKNRKDPTPSPDGQKGNEIDLLA